jgi:predicted nuclease of predicted toxin-antitoxin system
MSTSPKFLLDENLSWRVVRGLARAGYDAVHTQQMGLNGLRDGAVFQRAQQLQRCIITRDSDFLTRFPPPHHGIIVLECNDDANNAEILQFLLAHLPSITSQDAINNLYVLTMR